ncbi:MAG: hypothetical protein IJ727_12185, partial [Treponema sp.]|nr:hypothetical protein [Treponema sp.]
KSSNISTVAHIAGGLCGSMFGFLVVPKGRKSAKKEEKSVVKEEKSKASKDDGDMTVVGTLDI